MLPALMRRTSTGPLLLSTAAAFVLADLVIVWIGLQTDLAIDFTCCYQQASERALTNAGSLYDWSETYTFRYTPLGALVWAPLIGVDELAAFWAWTGFKLASLAGTAAWLSAPWAGRERWLVALAVITFPPIVHDLVIGNVSTLTVLAYLAVARWRDPRGGIALGLLAILMPKPHLVPVFLFLAIRRPRDFVTVVATMTLGLVVGVGIFGLDPWLAFIDTLREPLERTFTANIGFSALLGPAGVVIGFVVAAVMLAAGIRMGGARGYGLSIISGIVMGPYTFIHYLAGAIVAAEPVLRTRPRRLVLFPWLLVAFPLIPIWLAALGWVVQSAPEPPNRRHDTVRSG